MKPVDLILAIFIVNFAAVLQEPKS